jgi:hypothetical protein
VVHELKTSLPLHQENGWATISKNKIIEYNGISTYPLKRQKSTVMECPRYELVNALDTKYCSKYSYPLIPEAFDQIKQGDEEKFKELEKKANTGYGK